VDSQQARAEQWSLQEALQGSRHVAGVSDIVNAIDHARRDKRSSQWRGRWQRTPWGSLAKSRCPALGRSLRR
jgi:hypothetical protein